LQNSFFFQKLAPILNAYILRKYFLGIITALALFSCRARQEKGDKLLVVCTTGMIAEAVQHIVQDKLAVHTLIGYGTDPHGYKIRPQDLFALEQADLIVANGLHLEGKLSRVFEDLKTYKKIVHWSDFLPTSAIRKADVYSYDPHIWMDIVLWQEALPMIAETCANLSPENRAYFFENMRIYKEKLQKTHLAILKITQSIPQKKRVIITTHDAFTYFANRYDFQVEALQGISTEAEYGISRVKEITNFVVREKIPALFVEQTLSPRSVQAIIEASNARGHQIKLGGTLYADALSDAPPADTYTDMLIYNAQTIAQALNPLKPCKFP
jgi:manganese/zinc/iron transport system substrate-binding protein